MQLTDEVDSRAVGKVHVHQREVDRSALRAAARVVAVAVT